MCPTRRFLVLAPAALVAAWAVTAVAPAAPDPVAVAKAAVGKAKAEEKAAQDEWNSKEMARSATREIAVSARATAERAAKDRAAAEEALRQKRAAGNPAQVAAAEAIAAERTVTARTAFERLIADQSVANRATEALRVVERTLGQKMAATRTAERALLALAGEKTRGAVREAEAVAAWEVQQWLGVERSTLEQSADGNDHSARIAAAFAADEVDAARKKKWQEFCGEATAVKAAQRKAAAEKAAALTAMVPEVYRLRVAALGGLTPLAPQAWDEAKARHLLVRAGFGGTPAEVKKLHAMGLYAAVDYLVDFHHRPAAATPFDAVPPAPADPLEDKLRNPFVRGQVAGGRSADEGAQFARLRQWWLKRMVESPRPLQEKLTLFWHGHFATQYSVVQNSYAVYRQNQLFREHAAGNFGGLLYAIVHDPVMLRYLDNNTNVKGHANENLAREIMELFAMGAYQGYSETDVREAARALTGYTFDHRGGQFRYLGARHDDGPKTIFGKTGNFNGDDVVTLILEQPTTARFVTRKLFEFFAYQDPDPAVTDCLGGLLKTHNYELAPVLKNLFLSEEFYGPRAVGTQIKCPAQLVVGTLRDLGVARVADTRMLDTAVREMGQTLFEPPDVKGWRYGRPWISTSRVFVRYNAVTELVRAVPQPQGRRGVDVIALLGGGAGCRTSADVVDYLARACLVRPLGGEKRQELIAYLGELPPPAEWAGQRDRVNDRLRDLLVMMLCTPENQMT